MVNDSQPLLVELQLSLLQIIDVVSKTYILYVGNRTRNATQESNCSLDLFLLQGNGFYFIFLSAVIMLLLR